MIIVLVRFVFAAVFAAFAAVGLAQSAARVIFFAADVSDRARDYAFLLLNLDKSYRKQNHNAAACASRSGQSLHNQSRIYITPASAAAAAVAPVCLTLVVAAAFVVAAVFAVVAAALSDVADCAVAAVLCIVRHLNAAALVLVVYVQSRDHAPGTNAQAGNFQHVAREFAVFLICDLFC